MYYLVTFPIIFFITPFSTPVTRERNGGYPAPIAVESLQPSDFQKLTAIPIQIVYTDYIPPTPVPNYGQDVWRSTAAVATDFVTAINNQGGHASILSLPSIGLTGNSHFAFADLNNLSVADQMSAFLHQNGLD